MRIIKYLLPFLLSFSLIGCATEQPVFTFSLVKDNEENPTKYTLQRHPTSAISATPGKVVRLWMDNAYFTQLYDRKPIREGYSGRREVLIYAIIYKDGFFQKFSKITDLAGHMTSYQPVVVQKPNFFTETMDGSSYQIVIKAFEVDTEGLVRFLRRVNTTDVSKIATGTTPYAPGATFVGGLQDVLHGAFDMVLSVTGKSVDDWVQQIAADKVFEHSIYVVPTNDNNEDIKQLVLIASGDGGGNKLWTFDDSFDNNNCHSVLDNKHVEHLPLTEKTCLKNADYKAAINTKNNLHDVEAIDLPNGLNDFHLGKLSPKNYTDIKQTENEKKTVEAPNLDFVSHISISIERLSKDEK